MNAGSNRVAAAFDHVKRAAMRIENPSGTFDDQAVQISCADRFREGRAEPVQEVKDQRLLDLDFLVRPLQLANALALPSPRPKPPCSARDDEPGE